MKVSTQYCAFLVLDKENRAVGDAEPDFARALEKVAYFTKARPQEAPFAVGLFQVHDAKLCCLKGANCFLPHNHAGECCDVPF